MAKMTLKVKVNDPYFQYQPRVSNDACLVQIWWFQLKSVMSHRGDKVKMDRRRQRQYPFGLKGHGVKSGQGVKTIFKLIFTLTLK